MWFFLGYITGIITSIFIAIVMVYLRKPIEQKTTFIEREISKISPIQKGFIVEPESEEEEARSKIIARNNAMGRSTKLSELQ